MIYSNEWQVGTRFPWNKRLPGSERSDLSSNQTKRRYSMKMRGKTDIRHEPVCGILGSAWEVFLGRSPQLVWLAASWGGAAPGERCGGPLSVWSGVCFSTRGLCAGLHMAQFWWKVLANITYTSAPLQQTPQSLLVLACHTEAMGSCSLGGREGDAEVLS